MMLSPVSFLLLTSRKPATRRPPSLPAASIHAYLYYQKLSGDSTGDVPGNRDNRTGSETKSFACTPLADILLSESVRIPDPGFRQSLQPVQS
jgi:hypothetical protein